MTPEEKMHALNTIVRILSSELKGEVLRSSCGETGTVQFWYQGNSVRADAEKLWGEDRWKEILFVATSLSVGNHRDAINKILKLEALVSEKNSQLEAKDQTIAELEFDILRKEGRIEQYKELFEAERERNLKHLVGDKS